MQKHTKFISWAGLLCGLTIGSALAGDLYAISHPSVKLAPAEVRDVFLGDKQFAGSVKLIPVDNSAAQADFLSKVLSMESGKYVAAWTKKSFRDGLVPPAVKGSDTEVIEFVKKTPGAVGYVGSHPANVNIIQKY